MAEYPLNAAEREAIRAGWRERHLREAEAKAALHGLTINCREAKVWGNHPEGAPGCANTGVNCLCPCHDKPGEA